MRRNYRITIKPQGVVYWPFWPFKLKDTTIDLSEGFIVEVDQVDGVGLSGHPISIMGYVTSDGGTMTTAIDFNGGSRLKRITKRA